ncbi:insulin-degrading enzyme-like 1, peroxisomal [Amaranthus tricolor]|uniref:insulin-degrading enzyme-like 1, peroxisomal n=1 Tax=Amaranthus tricolor TaxID=29722 RepID=UPI00258FE909|nr:insulin-degrading enzyme-like 1, peroxisomal [Amaranthus tricolor]
MAVGKDEMVEILKPRTDKRDYKRVVLSNSLEVLLISDPDTDKCAASMNVNVGSFSDPEGLEGLAHFLEHMLFYASEKYPTEDSYSKYITEHGGHTNAFTASEYTNYYFDVNADAFEEALDRFAQFFIKPLMSPDATMREIKAVDSEHQKNLLSDIWRMNQLNKHLSSPAHAYHKFSTGSWETLEVRPKANGINTREELLKFYEEYYSANLMRLVVYAKESLDKIETMVKCKFQDIRNTNRNSLSFPGQPCTSDHLQILVKVVPIKEGHKLKISWPITPGIHYYKEGPCRYLGHLIGHEAEGSLFYVLKKLGWATGLSAGETDWNTEYSFFKVIIDLTDAGHENMQNVVGVLFKYVQLLQKSGVCEWIFNELSSICQTSFHYQDKTPPADYVVNISSNMHLYAPRDWLARSSLPSIYNPSTIQKILDELSPENVRIFWDSKSFEGHSDLSEPWYGTKYSLEKISASMIQNWMSASPNEHLHLPEANVFIPTDLSIKDFKDKVTHPILLRTSSSSRLWYKPDMIFAVPKAYVKIDFHCPYAGNSPESEVLTDIFTRLLMDYLNECAYDAQVAGLHYSINHSDCGFEVTVVGYNHKLRVLLDTIIDTIVKFEVRADRFAVIKETIVKEYQNYKFQQPYQQAMYYCSLIMQDHSWPWMEQLEVLPNLEADALSKFVPLMLSKAYFECYIAGNIEQSEAVSTVEHIESLFFKCPNLLCQPLFPSQHQTNRVVKLGKGKSYCYSTKGLNPSDENSCLVHYIQVHPDDYVANVKLELIALIAKQPTFHQLRSVEQLGYITVLLKRNIYGIHGLQFIIQSTAKGPTHIDQRVEAFLSKFENELRQLSEDEFKKNVSSLIDSKLEKHKNLREESRFYWKEITDGTFKFDRKESEVSALKQLTQQELISFFDEFVKVGATRKKTLSIRVYGSSHLSDYEVDMNSSEQSKYIHIDDIFSFRRSQPLYGSFRGGRSPTKL